VTERTRTFLCALYFFLVMASYYILKPVREAFFLKDVRLDELPLAHIVVSAATLVAAWVYARLVGRFTGRALVPWVNVAFVACVVAFWGVLRSGLVRREHAATFAWIYYVWVAVSAVFVVTLFWSFVHDMFRTEQGSRLYGFVGSGGVLGAIAGSALTGRLAERTGSGNLLVLAAALDAPVVVVAHVLGRSAEARSETSGSGSRAGGGDATGLAGRTARPPPASAWGVFRESQYVRVIALMVVLFQAIPVLVDYQAKMVVLRELAERDRIAAFYGDVFLGANAIGFLINVLLVGWLQTRWGPLPGLLTFPLVAGAGAGAFVAWPGMEVATVLIVLGQAVQYSIFQTSKELLYLPTGQDVKFVAKGVIDTFFFRLGNAAAAVWIRMSPPPRGSVDLCWLVLVLAAGMVVSVVWLAGAFRRLAERAAPGAATSSAGRA
jgi:AAA family ATP:ADP antiporter